VSDDAARARLAAAVPPNVREVCSRLNAAGYEAVTVGGAVRDAILGVEPGDWDIASSATPDQVMALFPRTIPTGVQHGTVTIVTGKGAASHVEVTTYRGEGAYTDSRRPDHVRFGVPLVEDLARRDLRVNAIAYDPITDRLIDPYNGQQDITDHTLRAVGPTGDIYTDAVGRFTEDGLRVMRAVRFAAQLEIPLHPDTERGLAPALPALAKVSKERISDELEKLLRTRIPSLGLAAAERTGIIALILPALAAAFDRWASIGDRAGAPERADVLSRWLSRIDAAPRDVRLAAFLVELGDPDTNAERQDLETLERTEQLLKDLKFSNAEARTAAQLASVGRAAQIALTPPQIRRLLAAVGRDLAPLAIALWRADASHDPSVCAEAERILAAKEPLSAKDLVVSGKMLIEALSLKPGRIVGRLVEEMVEHVLTDPTQNTRELLIDFAKLKRLEVSGPDD
jgi:tRNA nucleotidyltransferase (CCA-adding enzyme)